MSETNEAILGGRFTFPGTSLTVRRIGYGAMQLAGPGVWGLPKDPDGAIAVLREAVAAGVNHAERRSDVIFISLPIAFGPTYPKPVQARLGHSTARAQRYAEKARF